MITCIMPLNVRSRKLASPMRVRRQELNTSRAPYPIGGYQKKKSTENSTVWIVLFVRTENNTSIFHIFPYAQPLKNGTLLRVGDLRAQCFRNGCLKYTENRDYLEGLIGQAMLATNNGTMPVNAIECDTDADDGTAKFQTSPEVTLEGIQSWVPDFQYCDENTNPDIIDYLIERGVTQEDIDWLKVGWGPIRSPRTYTYLNDQLPWVIFPIIMNGKLRGVQARCPSKFLESGGIKYWFHPGFRKRTVVMNIDQARSIGVGVLCEGIFDVLKDR